MPARWQLPTDLTSPINHNPNCKSRLFPSCGERGGFSFTPSEIAR